MQPFATLTAVAAPLDSVNIDTDQIFPTRFLHKPRGTGFAKQAFHDLRFNTDGSEIAAFPLNQEPYRNAKIIVAGSNFGCGSSREGAVYALFDFGIRSVIAPSFGDITPPTSCRTACCHSPYPRTSARRCVGNCMIGPAR